MNKSINSNLSIFIGKSDPHAKVLNASLDHRPDNVNKCPGSTYPKSTGWPQIPFSPHKLV